MRFQNLQTGFHLGELGTYICYDCIISYGFKNHVKHQACRTILVVTFIASLIVLAFLIGALDAFPTPHGALFQKGVGTISPFFGGSPKTLLIFNN